jgi:hypothetical protein
MWNGLALAALLLLAAGCAPTGSGTPAPVRAADFKPEQIRRPAIFVRFGFSGQFEDKERQAMLADYEGALLEGLNARAVLAKDVQLLAERDPKLEPAAAVEQARTLGADHAVYVQVRVVRPAQPVFCAETRRAFRAPATALTQMVGVLRVSDGARRLVVPATGGGLDVYDFEPDCDNPRESKRRTPTEAINDAVTRLLNRVVGH